MTETARVSSRSKNIGIAWRNDVEQVGDDLHVRQVETPAIVGTPRQCHAEYKRAERMNHGNDWNVAVFVGGRRIVTDTQKWGVPYYLRYVLLALMEPNTEMDVEVE
jgi:hypothetical protein